VIVAAHQPAYLPWLGYFDKIARADLFVYLDTVQFEKNSFTNRNRIKTPQGLQWLTVPVKIKGHLSATLRDTQIDNNQAWRTKHLKAIALNYAKSPYFSTCFPRLEGLISHNEENLAEYCWYQLRFWVAELGIKTELVRSSTLPRLGAKSELVLGLCRHFSADHYLSGPLGREYLVEEDFDQAGIRIEYQAYVHPTYSQPWGAFVPGLSAVDAWMHCGSEALQFKR
jgi:hypothetical protein